jgi:hypothetical protein
MSDPLGVYLCSMCCAKEVVYCGPLLSPAYVESYGVETYPLLPNHSIPSSQATTDQSTLQLRRGIDLDGAHPGSLRAALSRICRYRTVYLFIVNYFSSSNTVSWNTPQMFYLHGIDCYYLLG